MRQPTYVPKYMNIEKVCTGMPSRSSVGFSSASWKEGNRAESVGMLMRATGLIDSALIDDYLGQIEIWSWFY
jgi:hypothetical protein